MFAFRASFFCSPATLLCSNAFVLSIRAQTEKPERTAISTITAANDSFLLLRPELLGAVAKTAQRVAAAVKKTVEPDGINLAQANGPGAGQSVFHFHIHVLPRLKGDELKLNWGHKPGAPSGAPSLRDAQEGGQQAGRPGDMAAVKAVYERIKANM